MRNELVKKQSPLAAMSDRLQIDAEEMRSIIMSTVMPNGGKSVTNEQFASFIAVANSYGLDPLKREIYAFPGKGNSIQNVVGIDGWLRIINAHPDFDGLELSENFVDGAIFSTTCTIYRKSTSHPTVITEYLSECERPTEGWKKRIRMMRHKATIQCSRYAFGLSGIVEQDEAEAALVGEKDITPAEPVSAIRGPVVVQDVPEAKVQAPAMTADDVRQYIATATNVEALEAAGPAIKALNLAGEELTQMRKLFSAKVNELGKGE